MCVLKLPNVVNGEIETQLVYKRGRVLNIYQDLFGTRGDQQWGI